ncbi:MAG: GNAT family N-acetyltransferase [Clostridia bacterium]|nr:GNAT family N-acetyltransferase [Clostridia bacterium]
MFVINDGGSGFAKRLHEVCANSPYGAKIEMYFSAYSGRYNFLDFWLCHEMPCAVCRYYDSVFVCGSGGAELNEFIEMLSPNTVLCDESIHLSPRGMNTKTGETMRCVLPSPPFDDLPDGYTFTTITGEMKQLREIYGLLCAEYGSLSGSFDEYFVDMSHRMRHGGSSVYTITQNGRAVSTLTVAAKSRTAAVIGSVATRETHRRRGLAGYLTGKVTRQLCAQGREVYLHRERMISIYEKIGFETVGRWQECRRNAV